MIACPPAISCDNVRCKYYKMLRHHNSVTFFHQTF
jgi:hypothetical protein